MKQIIYYCTFDCMTNTQTGEKVPVNTRSFKDKQSFMSYWKKNRHVEAIRWIKDKKGRFYVEHWNKEKLVWEEEATYSTDSPH